MNLIDLIHAKLELFRLEQRYTKRRNRRSTFVSDAQYVDGEYVYAPSSPSKRASVVRFSSAESEESAASAQDGSDVAREKGSRSAAYGRWGKSPRPITKRRSMVTVHEVNWEENCV